MRHLSPKTLFISAAAAALLAIPAVAQKDPPPEGPPAQRQMADDRPNLLKELGLTPDQLQQIRRMNQARRPLMEEAGRRVREANRSLDMAIYGDTLNEEDVAARLREFQL